MARMRALELGKPLIRATNTGISVFIDAKGNIEAQAPQFEEITLTHKMVPTEGKTPYAALGNFTYLCVVIDFVLLRGFTTLLNAA